MPPLPAISLPSPSASAAAALWASVKLYGDESYTNFFRRLTFSPDGGLLLTPAGQFEDPSVNPQVNKTGEDLVSTRGRRGHPSEGGSASSSNSSSSVYIYSRANFARPPIAQLPGHKKASVAVRFSPILYDLRPGVLFSASSSNLEHEEKSGLRRGDNPPTGILAKDIEGSMDVDIAGPSAGHHYPSSIPLPLTPQRTPAQSAIVTPTARPSLTTSNILALSPTLSPLDLRPPTPAASKPSTPVPSHIQTPQSQPLTGHASNAPQTGSLFALPYRLLFAVVTMDTVAIYDTQQASPICLLTKLHYDEFTDLAW
jgi:chromatin assembly factor 1 subunit B